jgi:fatty-acid peroxygenase
MVMWDVLGTNLDPATYSEAERFDPDRFAPGRDEHRLHPHAYVPQGGGPPTGHRCAGVDYSTVLMSVFLVALMRDYEWTLPAQNLAYDWGLTPPEPADGLKAVLRRR